MIYLLQTLIFAQTDVGESQTNKKPGIVLKWIHVIFVCSSEGTCITYMLITFVAWFWHMFCDVFHKKEIASIVYSVETDIKADCFFFFEFINIVQTP